ncbi:MAG: stage III sporulation protein AF [Thermoanaerobacteraceae bacterium]|nr:stage III sporulation protein AF [Thermoanaerobacteraceae bacterium]
MELVKNWIIQIAYISILSVIFEFMIPSSNLKRYVKVVIGLIIMITIINPVLNFLKGGFDINNAVISSSYNLERFDVNTASKEANKQRDMLIGKEFKKRLCEQIKSRISSKINASNIDINLDIIDDINDKNFGKINNLYIALTNPTEKNGDDDKKIENISVKITNSSNGKIDLNDIKNDISTFYNVPLKNITIKEN